MCIQHARRRRPGLFQLIFFYFYRQSIDSFFRHRPSITLLLLLLLSYAGIRRPYVHFAHLANERFTETYICYILLFAAESLSDQLKMQLLQLIERTCVRAVRHDL